MAMTRRKERVYLDLEEVWRDWLGHGTPLPSEQEGEHVPGSFGQRLARSLIEQAATQLEQGIQSHPSTPDEPPEAG